MKGLLLDTYPAEEEPDGDVHLPHHLYLGLIVTWYGFQFVWPRYPAAGATLTLIGLVIAADDAISHAFGVWTPLDWVWGTYLRRLVS